ncbi:MAG: tetratricopeptide repeat protein [Pyrinomonadaceae bacterium]
MKKVLFLFLLTIFSLNAFAQSTQPGFDLSQYGVRIEPDKRLMTVLAALEAAGIETLLTTEGTKFRQELQTDLQNLSPELRQKLKNFVDQYKRRHPEAKPSEIITPFITMAYTLSPAPDLADPTRTTDLPGDLLEVLDFAPLVREFYRALMKTKIDGYVKDYQKVGDSLRPYTAEMVSELLDYLHTRPQLTFIERVKTQTPSAKNKKKTLEKIEQRERTRQFLIVPELLTAKGTINFLNIGDDYFTIVPPETDVSSSEARRAFLQFVLDPLILKNAKDISTFREGIKTLLDERRKENKNVTPDIYLTTLRSLVAAVDARQIEFKKTRVATAQARLKIERQKTVEEKKAVSAELEAFKKSVSDETAAQLSEAYENGAVLSFYFAEQLKGLEDSGFDIAGSLRDIILSLDTTKEANRLPQFAEARKRALLASEERRKNVKNTGGEIVIESPVTRRLLEIEKVIETKSYTKAETELKRLLEENPSESRIYYALGRLAGLSAESITDTQARNRRLMEAKVHYTNVIRTATSKTDPALLSHNYVALGRIYEFLDDSAYALKLYEAAIKVGEVTGGAHKEAAAAQQRLMKEQ